MGWALGAVAAAAALSGTAVVLQARAARRGHAERLHVSVAWRLLRDPTYVVALLLVALGFAASFAALRVLPVFVVQAGRSSSLAVAALLATRLLGSRLHRREWWWLLTVAVGLVLLAWSTRAAPAHGVAGAPVVLVVGSVLVASLGAWVASRPPTRGAGLALATLAGAGYAILAGGVHTLTDLQPLSLVASPATWASLVGGVLGLGLTVLAFQRAPAVAVTAALTATETVGGALLGMVLAGDRAAPGRGVAALVGFLLVVLGSSSVGRLSAPDTPPSDASSQDARSADERGLPGAGQHLVEAPGGAPAEHLVDP
ncbi:MAG: hypothetical protein B7X40_00025 [Cellulomonas sp. 14-74-6]|jgi:drug/metabolite transporter (DMT)-like permease|nr:MAG: hypothetical protein B7X40_00025 [Cellulomonas sp. 14-74-6]